MCCFFSFLKLQEQKPFSNLETPFLDLLAVGPCPLYLLNLKFPASSGENTGGRFHTAPTRGSVETVNQGLDAPFDLFVGELIFTNERSEISINGRKCLRSSRFILETAEIVDHLITQSRKMLRWLGRNLAGDTKPFND